jgi:hypothetical protein
VGFVTGGIARGGGQARAQQAQGAGVLFLDRADGDAEPVGDFPVGEEFDFPQQQHRAAALGQLGDGLLELAQLLPGYDLLHHAG